jgi:hypothetical protein
MAGGSENVWALAVEPGVNMVGSPMPRTDSASTVARNPVKADDAPSAAVEVKKKLTLDF